MTFTLRASLTDGFSFNLDGEYPSELHAANAASRFMRDYSDPCGLGVRVESVAIIRKGGE